jgi:hypothetical protein
VGAIVALIIFLRLRKETRLRVKHAIFRDELCLKRLSGSRLATEISLVLRRLLGL